MVSLLLNTHDRDDASAAGCHRPDGTRRRVAIVHDWLPVYAGAERVLEQILNVYPEADLFSVLDFIPNGERGFLQNKPVKTTFVQKLPWAKAKYRSYLPIMPLAIEQLDLSEYDLVISSSYAVAKGVITGPEQLHICYCHSPIRYAWDMQNQYLTQSGLTKGLKGIAARVILHYIRMWDARTSHGVDAFIANSQFVARRIEKVYGRDSTVIHPPVDTDTFTPGGYKEDFYLTASRMVPYKKLELVVDAFSSMPDKMLVVIGNGPDFVKIKARAGSNVQLLGHQPVEVLRDHLQRARAFVFAAKEDFGITPLEAQACGTPVIAFGKGGATETILPGQTGLFFHEQTAASIQKAIEHFETLDSFSANRCRAHAEQFSIPRFRDELEEFVEREWESFRPKRAVTKESRSDSLSRLNVQPLKETT